MSASTLLDAPERLSFAERLDALHEMLYTRGGIRPVNAAIEELAKIVLLQLKHAHEPDWAPSGEPPLRETLDPQRLRAGGDAGAVKRAFSAAIALPEFAALVPGQGLQPIWPLDEPFRLERADVLAEALSIVSPGLIRELEHRRDYDLLGTAFDVLLRGRYDHSGGLATYLTPHSVATALAQLCLADLDVPPEWAPGQPCFGDPCCGTGRFLVAGLREARRIAEEVDDERRAQYLDAFAGSGIFAADQSASSVAKARLNLLLFGVLQPRVFTVEDSITDPHLDLARGRMRLILTNPPFGDGKYDSLEGIARTRRVLVGASRNGAIDPALAFVARCIDLLGDGGVLGIILPDGLVDGAVLRRALLANDSETRLRDISIQANISLPTATFALAGTMARTSAVVLRKGKGRRGFVFLARAQHVGYLKQNGVAVVDPAGDDLPAIAAMGVEIWRERHRPVPADGPETLCAEPHATIAPLAGLETVDPSRVDPSAHAARKELLEEGGAPLGIYLELRPRRGRRADGERPFVSVLHVDHVGAVDWYAAERYEPSTPGQLAKSGELLISLLNPNKLRATVIPEEIPEALCSSEFGVFAARVDPYVLLVLLYDKRVRLQLAPLGRGTSSSRRRIDGDDVAGLIVPRITPDVERRAKEVQVSHRHLRDAGLRAATALFEGPPTTDSPS